MALPRRPNSLNSLQQLHRSSALSSSSSAKKMPGLHLLLSQKHQSLNNQLTFLKYLNNSMNLTDFLDSDQSSTDGAKFESTDLFLSTLPVAVGILLTLLLGCVCVFMLAYVGKSSRCCSLWSKRTKRNATTTSTSSTHIRHDPQHPNLATVLRLSMAAVLREKNQDRGKNRSSSGNFDHEFDDGSTSLVSDDLLVTTTTTTIRGEDWFHGGAHSSRLCVPGQSSRIGGDQYCPRGSDEQRQELEALLRQLLTHVRIEPRRTSAPAVLEEDDVPL